MLDNPLIPAWLAGPTGTPDRTFKWDRDKAAHLLNRAGFGGTPEEVDACIAMGLPKTVESLVHPERVVDGLEPMKFGDLSGPVPDPMGALRSYFRDFNPEQKKGMFILRRIAQQNKLREMKYWWLDRMVRTNRPLEEKMTLFWHGLFVSAAPTVENTYHLYLQNDLFRRHALMDVKNLTLQVSKDPAMLVYLSNNQNKKEHPNENYARELMELFCMGQGQGYTEQDIKESARAFTGWTLLGDEYVFNRNEHDFGMKRFLNHSGNFDGADIVDIIFQHPATAIHFGEKLLRFFCDEPDVNDDPQGYKLFHTAAPQLGALLRRNGWMVAPTLQTLFNSKYFYSEHVMHRQIKSPMQLVVGSLRVLGVSVPNPQAVEESLRLMGQDLFGAPNVKGWDGGRAWVNTSTLFARYNLPAYLVTGKLPNAGKKLAQDENGKTRFSDFRSEWDPQLDLAQANAVTSDAVVDYYIGKLLQNGIDPHKRDDLIMFLNTTGDTRPSLFDPTDDHAVERLRGLVHLIMSMPEYQLC